MQNKKVLLLGGGGFLGKEFREVFAREGVEFLAPTRSELNVSGGELEKYISSGDFDVVVNCVGYTDVDGAEENKISAYELNADLPERLAKICLENNMRLVHFSTDYIFDGADDFYTENAEGNALSVYGESKLAGEKSVMEFANDYLLVRLSFPFGDSPRCFLQWLLGKIELGESLKIVDDLVCSPTDMHALAERVCHMITEDTATGVYHLACEGQCSRYEFARAVLDILGSKVDCESVPAGSFLTLAKRPSKSVLKNTKTAPMGDWRDALKKYLEG